MLLTIFPAKEARKSPSKLRRKFATNFAENFANFTLEIAGAYVSCDFFWGGGGGGGETCHRVPSSKTSFGDPKKSDSSGLYPFPLRKMTGHEQRGGKRIISGGVQNCFWGEVLWYVFPSPEFPPPSLRAGNSLINLVRRRLLN